MGTTFLSATSIHKIDTIRGTVQHHVQLARMPTDCGRAMRVDGNWNENIGGAARTEQREWITVSLISLSAANSCPEPGDWKTRQSVLSCNYLLDPHYIVTYYNIYFCVIYQSTTALFCLKHDGRLVALTIY
jgi:hypothetical protein